MKFNYSNPQNSKLQNQIINSVASSKRIIKGFEKQMLESAKNTVEYFSADDVNKLRQASKGLQDTYWHLAMIKDNHLTIDFWIEQYGNK